MGNDITYDFQRNFDTEKKEAQFVTLLSHRSVVKSVVLITFTFPFSGMALFIILAMLAMGKNRSCSRKGVFFDVPPSLQESSELSTVVVRKVFLG